MRSQTETNRLRADIHQQTADFLARGNHITKVPIGFSGEKHKRLTKQRRVALTIKANKGKGN